MSKTKTVMVDKVGGISYPENFISANNIAQFGYESDAVFRNIEMHGDIAFGTDTGELNFWGHNVPWN